MLFLCWKLILNYSWFRRYNQYLLVIFNIGYIAFNPFEPSMEGMTWKHIPLDVINAVRFVVVPWKKRTQKRPYTNHSFNIIVSIKNPTNNTFSKSLTVPVYRLFISKTNLEKNLEYKTNFKKFMHLKFKNYTYWNSIYLASRVLLKNSVFFLASVYFISRWNYREQISPLHQFIFKALAINDTLSILSDPQAS